MERTMEVFPTELFFPQAFEWLHLGVEPRTGPLQVNQFPQDEKADQQHRLKILNEGFAFL